MASVKSKDRRPRRTIVPSFNQGEPGHTLYCKNLNEKIKKEDLRRNLYAIFSAYGQILDIVALRGAKNKGQAHVVFRDVAGAQAALRGMQGFSFCGKEMVIEWARGTSRKVIEMRARELGEEGVQGLEPVIPPNSLVDNKGILIEKMAHGDAMDVQADVKGKRELDEKVDARQHKRFHSLEE